MKNYERGSTITESMLCLIVLIILTFGFLGIFQLFTTRIATEYGAYQAARARSLGYNDAIVMRAGRLGVAAVSGPDISAVPLPDIDNSYLISGTATAHAKDYLNHGWGFGNAYAVNYAYWDHANNQFGGQDLSGKASSDLKHTSLFIGTGEIANGEYIQSQVFFSDYPLLLKQLYAWIGFKNKHFDTPSSTATLKNHARNYLETENATSTP